MNQNDWEAISTDFGRISSTRPSNSHGFTVRLKFSDVTSRSRGLTRSKSHGEPKLLKLLIIFIPKSNLCYFLYSFGNHIGFKAIILCFVGSRRRSMGKNFGIFLLKKSECGVSQMQSGKEFWIIRAHEVGVLLCFVGSRRRSMEKNFGLFLLKKYVDAEWKRILDYSCSRSQSIFVLCGVSQLQSRDIILDYSCSRSQSTFVLRGVLQMQYGKEFWIILAQEVRVLLCFVGCRRCSMHGKEFWIIRAHEVRIKQW